MPMKTLLKYGKIRNLNLLNYATLVDKLSAISSVRWHLINVYQDQWSKRGNTPLLRSWLACVCNFSAICKSLQGDPKKQDESRSILVSCHWTTTDILILLCWKPDWTFTAVSIMISLLCCLQLFCLFCWIFVIS